MIVLLATGAHTRTHEALRRAGRFDLRLCSYHRAWRRTRFRRATYIFADLDRLSFWELELASRLYRRLAETGNRVLNDPARVRQRYSLLRCLKAEGLNDFNVWRVEEADRPERYPVFLRTESAHRGTQSDLLHDAAQVQTAIDAALQRGLPRRELLLVEYCGEPIREGLFRKHAMFRVGDRLVPTVNVHETKWQAKGGKMGIAGQALYDDEYEMILTNRFADRLGPVFDIACVDYGRADFGVVAGRTQVYEINTNPFIGRGCAEHPFPVRVKAAQHAFRQFVEAFEAIDSLPGPTVQIDDEILARQRRRDRWVIRTPWMP